MEKIFSLDFRKTFTLGLALAAILMGVLFSSLSLAPSAHAEDGTPKPTPRP